MAAGRVILFCANTRNNPLHDAGVGYTINPDDIDKLEKTILEIYNLSYEKRAEIGSSLRLHVEKNYAITVLADKLESLLLKALR
jgi:glycosyltransferase involved in cell wall biosynthesis